MLKRLFLFSSLCLLLPVEIQAQTWNQKANIPATARHRSTALSIGNKGYAGMGHLNTVSNILFEDWWEYNPASNTWTQKADFGGGPRYHCHGFTIGGKAYVGTGRDWSSYKSDNWEYDPATNAWTAVADLPGNSRRGTVSFVVDDLGYVGSGLTSGGGSNNFYAYNAVLDSWTQVSSFPGQSRNSAVAFAIGTNGYMGTGDVGGWNATNDFWEYNTLTDTWTQKANASDSVRRQATGFALGGFGYIGTGHNPGPDDDVDDFWKYDPATDTWEEVEEFLGVSRRYMASFVIGNKAYTCLGTNGINFNDLWEYNPNYTVANFPILDDVQIILTERSSGGFGFKLNNLSGSHDDLAIVISNKEGKIIQKMPVVPGETNYESIELPDNCVYRLVKDGKVVKAHKISAQK